MAHAALPSGITLWYDDRGRKEDPVILLVPGLGSQAISHPDDFCDALVAEGFRVIRIDNRDAGLSTIVDSPVPPVRELRDAIAAGDMAKARSLVPYLLSDMAQDIADLLDVLNIDRINIVGSSMGGMIAQTFAIEHSDRCSSLTSIMSTTGELEYGRPTPEALTVLLTPRPSDRDGYIDASVEAAVWASRRYTNLDELRLEAAASFDRSYQPEGIARQFAAIQASGSRAEGLRHLQVPTLVIHGSDDTLIEPSGGRRTAELVSNSRFVFLDDMGHDRPRQLWPDIIREISAISS
jgi:pimeloyl-ACP methyl ester carboxylesterase